MQIVEKITQAVDFLPERIRYPIIAMQEEDMRRLKEIRIRRGFAVSVVTLDGTFFLKYSGTLCTKPNDNSVLVASEQDLNEAVIRLCNYSLHAYQNEMINGYITVKGGHRIGICASAVTDMHGRITAVKNVSSINIRIAREIVGVADRLMDIVYRNSIKSVLVVGEPSSGKTTLLRDAACRLASADFDYQTVCIIDERRELLSVGDMGKMVGCAGCDLLDGYPKAHAMMLALRSLAPDIIVCDEIGDQDDVYAIEKVANAGVKLLASIHADSFSQLIKRPQFDALMRIGAFDTAVILEGKNEPCKIRETVSLRRYWR